MFVVFALIPIFYVQCLVSSVLIAEISDVKLVKLLIIIKDIFISNVGRREVSLRAPAF